mmetsp:Transcript_17700/g.41123  ORF Transcript_17700/g.41123 Transcript_17700/m.41123 type:complete len:705 (-) Transcript_17700:47-2161(-)|eukprot:CAMPEP_0178450748 /NCGR_PEP_ID=MMETSP0689_2-20121128/43295_1 /TAXON_ID=160604 /ORGANISM="Amphidinium massartii, Strain CS-259" /LENGTH=704 /DNA_ID=CAMNT_0020076245 /DNA_START=57 /DNA_END=2171 /DNA_ORIENTATION=+
MAEIAWQDLLARAVLGLGGVGIILIGILIAFLIWDVDEDTTLGVGKALVVSLALTMFITSVLLLLERKTMATRLPACTSWRMLGSFLIALILLPITSLGFVVCVIILFLFSITMMQDEGSQIASIAVCDAIVSIGIAESWRIGGAWDDGGLGQLFFTLYVFKGVLVPTMMLLTSMLCMPKLASAAAGSLLVCAVHCAAMALASVELLVDKIFNADARKLTTEGKCVRSPIDSIWQYTLAGIANAWGDADDAPVAPSDELCIPDPQARAGSAATPETAGSVAFWVFFAMAVWLAVLMVVMVFFPLKRQSVQAEEGAGPPSRSKSMKLQSATTLALENLQHAGQHERERRCIPRSPTRWLCIITFLSTGAGLLTLLLIVVPDDVPREVLVDAGPPLDTSCRGVSDDYDGFCNSTCAAESTCTDLCRQQCSQHCWCNLGLQRCGLFCYRSSEVLNASSSGRLLADEQQAATVSAPWVHDEHRQLQDAGSSNATNSTPSTTSTTTFDIRLCFGEVCNECEECWQIPTCEASDGGNADVVGPDTSTFWAFASLPAEYLAITWCDLDGWAPLIIGLVAYAVNAYACAMVGHRAYVYTLEVTELKRQSGLWRDLGKMAKKAQREQKRAAHIKRVEAREAAGGGQRPGFQRQGSNLSAQSQMSKYSVGTSVATSMVTDPVKAREGLWMEKLVRKEPPPAPIAVDEDGRVFKV